MGLELSVAVEPSETIEHFEQFWMSYESLDITPSNFLSPRQDSSRRFLRSRLSKHRPA